MAISIQEVLQERGGSEAARRELASIAYVAHLYYNKGMLQPDIAEKLFFSRSKVSRMLKQARELGIVEITVHPLVERVDVLEKLMTEKFGLRGAVVISDLAAEERPEESEEAVAECAATYLEELLSGEMIVGVTSGLMLEKVIAKLHRRHSGHLQCLQLMGSASDTFQNTESRQLVNNLLEKFPGTGHYLNAPLFIADDHTLDIILHDRTMQDILLLMQHSDIAVTGIGAVDEENVECRKWGSYMTPAYYRELTEHGAVGSICGQYYDIEGTVFDCTWNTHCVRMPLGNIARLPVSVGIACGGDKVRPIIGALKGRFLNTLVTDADTASAVLASI